ncbi:hypothetical protein A6R68_04731, partial [Neotoma lepida]
MALGGKEPKSKKGRERSQSSEDGVGNAAADYLVGQVADSLRGGQRPPGGGTGRLAALFSTAEPRAPPVFVPVPQGLELVTANDTDLTKPRLGPGWKIVGR